MSKRASTGKATATPPPAAVTPDSAQAGTGKGRPTPKRSEAQKRRGGAVPPPPASRREAAQRLRAQQAQDRKATRDGTMSGDPAKMLRRDVGPERALVRDVIDSRRNVAVVMLPVALVYVVSTFSRNTAVIALASRLFSLVLLLVVTDLVVTALVVVRRVRATFPGEPVRGHIGYGLLRTTVFRRMRMPPARVRPAALLRRGGRGAQ